jgi:hypothetical protein
MLWAGPEVPENVHKTNRKHLFSIEHNHLFSFFTKTQPYVSVDKLPSHPATNTTPQTKVKYNASFYCCTVHS